MNGMAGNEDGDDFFDDEFPDIPDDEYQRLEQHAIASTQQRNEDISRRQNVITHPQRPGASAIGIRAPSKSLGYPGRNLYRENTGNAQQDSSDATIVDEDGLPLVVEELPQGRPQRQFDETAQREQWRVNRFAPSHVQVPNRPSAPPSITRQNAHNLPQRQAHTNQQNAPASRFQGQVNGIEDEALRARIAELIRERDELTTHLRAAQDEVYVRRGEVANIRAKQSEEEKIHQRHMSALQRSKQEEADKHAVSMEAMKAENAQVSSEIQFLKQELKDESRKAQAYQRQMKERPLADKPANINTTPKRSHALRDGFDDDEMINVSPVKSGRRSKQNTPTANRKRKQLTGNEPAIQPLPLRLSSNGTDTGKALAKTGQAEVVVRKDHAAERHLRLIQKVTNFRPSGGQDVLIQRLFDFSFPSDGKKSFAPLVVDALARLEGSRFSGDLVQIFVGLWSKARQEQYYKCIPLMIEVISYIIDLDPCAIDSALLQNMLSVLQSTVEINSTARFLLMRKDYLTTPSIPKPKVNPVIDNTRCLELLHTIACLITDDVELINLLWRSISTDFVLAMLSACQPVSDIILMLQILASSVLRDTFGPICEASQQNRFEGYICDRLCYLLWELPKPDADKPPCSQRQICLLRQESLNFISHLTVFSSPNPLSPSAASNHGTDFFVNHPAAISRLIRSVYDELATAHYMTPTQGLHVQLVNTAMRILHFVLFSPGGRQIHWQSKINGVNGGAHKFRVAMARLAYAEGAEPGIDAGITEDTVRMATELLEESVTPDEVEDLVRVFEGDSVSSTRRTSGMTSTQR